MSIELLYGREFWDFIECAIPKARKHVFLLSAYARNDDISHIFRIMPRVPNLLLVRDDCKLDNKFPNLIYVDKRIYHAKIYVIDDEVIIGSQNLNKVTRVSLDSKVGEVSVKFKTDESTNIIYQALIIILKQEYEYYFEREVDDVITHYEINERDARIHVAGNIYLKEFRDKSLSICPCCGSKIQIAVQYSDSQIEGEEDEEAKFYCNSCTFFIEIYKYAYCYDRPWERTEQVLNFRCSPDFQLFLKLHFYLSIKIGRNKSLELLKSLNLLGSIQYLDLNKRSYNGLKGMKL
ncbi:hypothetical protein PSECIP111951_02664 [Pseudoalteromonas holothuriae]|uniref:PLD phosphodiesterase domain-containing protein n=1 Tax=Pseudoalteromonas holothuriae TaxID=2963714 RepID=A0ABM9GL46_9GAMM|nr:hypothetical protein [Pseudoalteromonas sp. CIP111951]CAH9062300.1 hypothetical protein PSECIP111951_02664 [Pseudoalteromonas sp. CIP111951]